MGTVSARSVRFSLHAAELVGINTQEALRAAGIDPHALDNPDDRVPTTLDDKLTATVLEKSGDEELGLHAAQMLRRGRLGTLDFMLRNSESFRQALERICVYSRLVVDGDDVIFEERDGVGYLSVQFAGTRTYMHRRFESQAWLAGIVIIGRQATGMEWEPREVRFPFARPKDVEEYERIFRVPVTFGADAATLVVDKRILDLPITARDQQLDGRPAQYASDLMTRLPHSGDVADRVCRAICDELQGGEPTIERIAKKLGTSTRTLQRRLGEVDAPFQNLLSDMRREMALRYLRDKELSIGEIAFLLGFSSVSGFNKAFRRWFGTTAGAHRRMMARQEATPTMPQPPTSIM